jgi:hypothetical protein
MAIGGFGVMAETSVAEIPAGWYPDPMGLPQRRWWDSSSWTQHVTPERRDVPVHQDALRPQSAGSGADSRNHAAYASRETAGSVGTLTQTRPTDRDEQRRARAAVVDVPQMAHAYIPMAMNTPVQFRQPEGPRASGTAAAWMIAVMPAVQLAAVLALILVLEDFGRFMQVAVAFVFFLWTAVLASHDKRRLLTLGHRHAATPWWILLTPLAYLIARTQCVRKQGGQGSAPMWIYILLSTIPAVVAVSLFVGADAFRLVMLAAAR